MSVMVPHLAFPVRFEHGRAAVVEQGSRDDLRQRVRVTLGYPARFCVDLPEFGAPDQTFRQGGADLRVLREVVDRWEPDARVALDAEIGDLAAAIDNVTVTGRR